MQQRSLWLAARRLSLVPPARSSAPCAPAVRAHACVAQADLTPCLQVGGLVVRQLAAQGTPVMALARSADSAAARELAGLANVEVRQGDVRELASLKSAAVGCENIVACYGMSPPRFPKLSDLWTDPFDDAVISNTNAQ